MKHLYVEATRRLDVETDLQKFAKHIDRNKDDWKKRIEAEHENVKFVGRDTTLATSRGMVVGLWDGVEEIGYSFGRL